MVLKHSSNRCPEINLIVFETSASRINRILILEELIFWRHFLSVIPEWVKTDLELHLIRGTEFENFYKNVYAILSYKRKNQPPPCTRFSAILPIGWIENRNK